MDAQHIVDIFDEVVAAVRSSIDGLGDWGLSGRREGQYTIDVAADQTALSILHAAGFRVLSEESGVTGAGELLVVIDPIDGSTNASIGLPWFATSLCAVDLEGPLVSVVVNQATGDRWQAIRGDGAARNGLRLGPPTTERLADAIVAVSGLPERHFGWQQFRCYGAAALDICAVADGTFGAFADLSIDAHGAWDYLGALLVLQEAGGAAADARGRDLLVTGHQDRRTPVCAATTTLLDELLDAIA